MCGIAGVYQFGRKDGDVSPKVIERMRDSLEHRGPDGLGLFVSEDRRVGLGHRRLAIVDPAGGQQPMFGHSGECLVFNGEIYNYPQLRRELERDGAEFRTNCDTEVILHLYERYGADCVERLVGMFAFALWDPGEERLLLARDPIGEKPVYWACRNGSLLFGSEIKALIEHPALTPEVNEAAVGPYFANLVSVTPSTLFKDVFKLPPGGRAICDRTGVRVDRYWNGIETRRWDGPPLGEAASRVREMLGESVRARLMSDVPVGVLLSGGLDSTTIVALLREQAQGMATFSVGFSDSSALDERHEARRVARHFGTDHHEVEISETEALGFLPRLVHHQDEPLADPVCIPLNFVCGLAQEHEVKVVLVGEGADELFWGYPRYLQTMARWRWIRAGLRLPAPVRRLAPRIVNQRRHASIREAAEGMARGKLLPIHAPLGLTRAQRELLLSGSTDLGWEPSANSGHPGESPLQTLAFDTQEYEFGLRLPELLLMRIDRFSMANSVEARAPFLDPSLVEFVYRLPLEQRLDGEVTKVVLRKAVADIVPDWVLRRPKQGFGAPVAIWLQRRLGRLLRELLQNDHIASFFNVTEVLRLQQSNGGWPGWPILNFALWHRYWIQREPIETLLSDVGTRD